MKNIQVNNYDNIANMYNLAMQFGYYDFSIKHTQNIIDLFKKSRLFKKNRSLLDLGCGTGQVAIKFYESGFDVTGIDISDGMIRNAILNLGRIKGADINFSVGDATNFQTCNKFGFVVSLFSVINHLESMSSLKECFKCVHRSLDSGGIFLFDMFTSLYLENLEPIKVNKYSYEEKDVCFIREVEPNGLNRVNSNVTCFYKDGKPDIYNRFINNIIFNKYLIDDVLNLLKEVGFSNCKVISANGFIEVGDGYEKHKQIFITSEK